MMVEKDCGVSQDTRVNFRVVLEGDHQVSSSS